MHEGLPIWAATFYGVAEETLGHLLQGHPMRRKRGQRISADFTPHSEIAPPRLAKAPFNGDDSRTEYLESTGVR
jgi:hypothetical protein